MSDYIVRATAANSQIRAFAAVTTDMVETARKNHNTSPVATAALGRLLTGGAMMGAMMKGEKDLLTLRIHAGGPLQGITVTADSHGNVKGYVGLFQRFQKGRLLWRFFCQGFHLIQGKLTFFLPDTFSCFFCDFLQNVFFAHSLFVSLIFQFNSHSAISRSLTD